MTDSLITIFRSAVILLIFSNLLFSQSRDIEFEHISSGQGLSQNTVYCIFQDSKGYMWFGTANGLNRYDGYTYKKYFHEPGDSSSLSNSFVFSIFEDHTGTLWIGTVDGLNKFERTTERFVHYRHNPDDPKSLSNSYVRVIVEDRFNTMWVGTANGLNKFDRETVGFTHYNQYPDNPESGGNNYILSIFADRSNTLWVGTFKELFKYNREEDKLVQPENWFDFFGEEHISLSSIYQDRLGILWFGSWGRGLVKLDPETGNHIHYHTHPPRYPVIDGIFSFYEDRSGTLWIGTDNGLLTFNPEKNLFVNYHYQSDNFTSLSNNVVRSLYEDQSGVFWLGTDGGGLNKFVRKQKGFVNYCPGFDTPENLRDDNISSIAKDQDGIIWIGTWGNGLYKFNREKEKLEHLWIDPNGILRGSPDYIRAIHINSDGSIWVGTAHHGGLHKYDRKTNSFIHYKYNPENPFSLTSDHITDIYEDSYGTLWIGTDPGGLNRFDRETERFVSYQYQANDPFSLSNNKVSVIFADRSGTLWIGTWGGGLNKLVPSINPGQSMLVSNSSASEAGHRPPGEEFEREKKLFIRYKHKPDDLNSLSDNRIQTIYEAPQGVLWIGTSSGGLNKFEVEKNRFTHYTVKDGLPINGIRGILSDDSGNLWISTDNGLSKFNIQAETFRNYDVTDGLPGNEFNDEAHYKSNNGELFFGTKNGFTAFYPDSLKDNPFIPPVVLSDFYMNNKPAKLDTAISEIKHIELSYKENIISFQFAALSYIAPEKNQYRYKLAGFDEDWVHSETRRFASYTNLDPGDYIFKVQASNNDGVWNTEGASLKITITPPWWQTYWAYGFYGLLIIALLYGWRRFEHNRARIRNELKIQRFEANKLREIDQMKSRFFANISHEFRTPLTLILGPVEKMLSEAESNESKQELSIVQRHARRLLRLINQLLDLSKLEAGGMKLQAAPENIVELTRQLAMAFESLGKRKQIQLSFQASTNEIAAYIDRDKFEKIVTNLLSNAFKFTGEGGKVEVAVSLPTPNPSQEGNFENPLLGGEKGVGHSAANTKPVVDVTVRDTGAGIPAEHLPHIFDRFFQSDDSAVREHSGTGIGLALTKESVEMHHGEISVHSEVGKGTTFMVRLPLGKEHLQAGEIMDDGHSKSEGQEAISDKHEIESKEQRVDSDQEISNIEAEHQSLNRQITQSPNILIVEDNPDMRTYMRSHLERNYRIFEAKDGAEGLKKALSEIPDLIISDVMMPKMDGFEMCRKVKTDEKTSHISVILLTARASGENKVEGLETGADDYITKPFDAKELLVRVKNLIEQRRKLKERYNREILLQPGDIAVTSMDEQFLQRAINIIEEHLSNNQFDVEIFSKEIGMSRRHLNRKLQALTNYSARQFIQTMRLKRAAQLLQKKSAPIIEIAYEVGFSNPSHFAECFRKQFGVLPSQYTSQF